MIALITTALSLFGTIMGQYLSGKKDKSEKERKYQAYIEAKKAFFTTSTDQYEDFEDQKKRMDDIRKQKEETEKSEQKES